MAHKPVIPSALFVIPNALLVILSAVLVILSTVLVILSVVEGSLLPKLQSCREILRFALLSQDDIAVARLDGTQARHPERPTCHPERRTCHPERRTCHPERLLVILSAVEGSPSAHSISQQSHADPLRSIRPQIERAPCLSASELRER